MKNKCKCECNCGQIHCKCLTLNCKNKHHANFRFCNSCLQDKTRNEMKKHPHLFNLPGKRYN